MSREPRIVTHAAVRGGLRAQEVTAEACWYWDQHRMAVLGRVEGRCLGAASNLSAAASCSAEQVEKAR